MTLFNRQLSRALSGFLLASLALTAAPEARAQVQAVDPDSAIGGDLARPEVIPAPPPPGAPQGTAVATPIPGPSIDTGGSDALPADAAAASDAARQDPQDAQQAAQQSGATYQKDDLVGAAEGIFGKGAAGLAGVIEDLLSKQGEPNAYIVGREGGAALGIGLRYGSGTLHHKVEGERPVYWTGPSVGFDAGANVGNTFVLVYNLYDSEQLFKRYMAGEGQAYFIGGFHVSYLRAGDKVLIPVRAGAGLRLGVNAGYMKFTHRQNWIPF